MTRTLILGGGGMIGQKLAARLAATSDTSVDLFDIGFPDASAPGTQIIGSVTSEAALMQLAAQRYDVIYHLASIVSGEAEQDFAKGWQTNMLPMWQFLELLRAEHEASGGAYVPRVVFTSSIAVFGGPYPDVIDDDFRNTPATSYGAQKSVCELMLSDMSRKGYVDGISVRLPTICVRPGTPNAAASGFFSGIIREPLNGQDAILPVSDAVRAWHASPRAAARFLTHAAAIDLAPLGARRALNMPGLSCTVAEQIEALRRVAGQAAVDRIKHVPDPAIQTIVDGWPRKFDAARATALGFEAESSFDEIIAVYLEDDLERRA
jgi:nucleoside-diphosphate-sugar epimerase